VGGLDSVEKRKTSFPYRELNSARPTCSPSLSRLSYLAIIIIIIIILLVNFCFGLSDDAVCCWLYYAVLNGRMVDALERIWKEAALVLARVSKIVKTYDSWCPG
jgi:hypothetical protein